MSSRRQMGVQPQSDRLRPGKRKLPLRYLLLIGTIGVLYFLAAKVGLSLAFVAEQVTAVWPPTGIALAAVLIAGTRVWPGIWLGAFLANALTSAPLPVALGIATGNTLEAITAAWLLQRFVGFRVPPDRLRHAIGLVLLGAALSTTVSATIGVTSLCLGQVQPWSAFRTLWWVWWLGDAVGDLLVAPVVLTWPLWPRLIKRLRHFEELAILLVMVVFVSQTVFSGWLARIVPNHPLEYTVFPFVIWAALRFGHAGASLVTAAASTFAIWGTVHGSGPYAGIGVHESLILLQVFLGVIGATGLMLGAAISERNMSERRRQADHAVTHVLAEAASLGDTTPRILQAICEHLEWDVGELWTVDKEANLLRCVAIWHKPGVPAPEFAALSRRLTFAPGTGLPGRVWETGEPSWIQDVVVDRNFPRAAAAAAENLHGAFGFPVRIGNETAGVVEFFSRDVRAPDEDLLRMFGAIGSQIGQFMDRKRAEEERAELLTRERAARAAAESADRLKDEFLATVSHELRTPLNAVLGWTAMLRRGSVAAERIPHALQTVERNAQVQAQLIDDLLDVSRIITGRLRLDRREIDLAHIVQGALEAVRPAAEAKGIRLHAMMQGVSVTVGDAARLHQIVWNLLSNAVKFTPRGGSVEVTLQGLGPEAELSVKDNGIGFAPGFQPYLFDRFRQADSSASRAHGGLGLGLAIVRHLVELHGGTVRAESAGEGQGATFIVMLPLRSLPASAGLEEISGQGTWDSSAADASIDLHGLQILIVEDEEDSRELVRTMLENAGATVIGAASAREGLDLVAGQMPDIVIADIGMPAEDGYTFIRKVRALPSDRGGRTPAIALTAYARPEDAALAIRAGFQQHVAKPASPGTLLAKIAALTKPRLEPTS